jgi:hypothetical protein
VPAHRVEALLGLARQGIGIGVEFGPHALEAMAWVGLTVERSVYQPDSFLRTPTGLQFVLANPPLRTGAFAELRVGLDGRPPTATALRWRGLSETGWHAGTDVSRNHPLEFRPGEPLVFEVDAPPAEEPVPVRVRVELRSVAIPPLVWFEFTDTPRPPSARR